MGKRIEDLPLDDTPISRPEPDPDPRGAPWYRFVCEIEDLLATGEYTWAEDTLRSIQHTVDEQHWVTEGQKRAVANIEAGHARGQLKRRSSRRYEGW